MTSARALTAMESRLLWRGFVGLTAIGSIIATAVAALAVVAVKFL